MVYCPRCGKKIGLLKSKILYRDKQGNVVKYCYNCYQERIKEDKVEREKLEKVKKKWKQKDKEWEQKEKKEQEKRFQQVAELCQKYLSTKEITFLAKPIAFYDKKDIYELVDENTLHRIRAHFTTLKQQIQERTPTTPKEYDEVMFLEKLWDDAIQYIQDVEKIKKLLRRKEIEANYKEIIKIMSELSHNEMKKMTEKLTIPAYKKISKTTSSRSKKQIIKEYLKLGFGKPDESIIEDLFDKFGLSYKPREITRIIDQVVEEIELDEFEQSLGKVADKKIGDFEGLNGIQFENYLKELFSRLDYQVWRTKSSGDQGADLIIKKNNEKTVVQAKKYRGVLSNKAIQEVVASKKYYGANKAMVVTTGTFTKNAVELAKSNNVELWDKKKLKKIIDEINKSSTTDKQTLGEQSVHLLEDYSGLYPFSCPYCDAELKLKIEDLPKKGELKIISCPECTADLGMRVPEGGYICGGCKKEFVTMKESMHHMKQCKKLNEKRVICKHCKLDFILNDSELEELNKKGTLKVDCPECKKSNIIKKD